MKLIVELFYVEFRFKAFEKDSFFKSFHRSEKKMSLAWSWLKSFKQILQKKRHLLETNVSFSY